MSVVKYFANFLGMWSSFMLNGGLWPTYIIFFHILNMFLFVEIEIASLGLPDICAVAL